MSILDIKEPHMDFDLSEQDWAEAEEALRGKPNGTKFDKYPTEPKNNFKSKWILLRKHSFIIIDEIIYALSKKLDFQNNTRYGQPLIKNGLKRTGEIVDIAIESTSTETELAKSQQVKTQESLYSSRVIRTQLGMHMTFPKPIGRIQTNQKVYTILESREAFLCDQLSHSKPALSSIQKRILSLRICLLIKYLHDKKNIVHNNIQTKNFVTKIDGHYMALQAIHFTFSEQNKNLHKTVNGSLLGTLGFMSNEIFYNQAYSFSSDIFSLAIMLIFQCDVSCNNLHISHYHRYVDSAQKSYSIGEWLNPIEWMNQEKIIMNPELKTILFGMLNVNPVMRTSINHLIKYLCEQLVQEKNLESDLKTEFNKYLAALKPAPAVIFSPFQIKDLSPQTRQNLFIKPEPDMPLIHQKFFANQL